MSELFQYLMQGDCLELMKQIPDNYVDMVMCDLPYGTTQNKWDSVLPLKQIWDSYNRICKGAVVLTAAQPFTSALIMSNVASFKYEWIWRKEAGTGLLNAKKQPLRNHEEVCVFYKSQPIYNPVWLEGKPYRCKKGGETSNYNPSGTVVTESDGRRYPLTVLDFNRDRNKVHPTQKPVALMEYLIKTYSNEGMIVLDNCMGSGTTGVACVNLNRSFIGIEQDEQYFKIAERRIADAKAAKSGAA
jgi:site-specific DNA-methyltransferase (adenine-specific)